MSIYNSNLSCEYKGSVNEVEPISHRRYTFLQNNEFKKLIVALKFDSRNTDVEGNEILGEWAMSDEKYVLYFHVNIKPEENTQSVAIRDLVVRENLTDKIIAILNAEKDFIDANSELINSRVIIYFKSSLPYYSRIESWGSVRDYLESSDISYLKQSRKEIGIIKNLLSPYVNSELEKLYLEKKSYSIDVINIQGDELLGNYEASFILRVDIDNENKEIYKFDVNFGDEDIYVSKFIFLDE